MFIISSSILHLVKDISHSFAPLSDHKQICINLVGLQPISKMRGYWKCNNALLKDTKFNDSIINLAKELFTNMHNGYKERWEYFKYKSRLIAIKICKELKASRLQTKSILLCRLNELLSKENVSEEEKLESNKIHFQINELYLDSAK